jgi:hypothetical protein
VSQHDGGLIEHHVVQVQIEACKAENGGIVKWAKVRQAVDHIALWKGGGAPLENMKAFRGRLLGLADMMQGHPVYEEVLRMAAQMFESEISLFKPLPLVDTQVCEEKTHDDSRDRGKVLRLSTGAHEWMR